MKRRTFVTLLLLGLHWTGEAGAEPQLLSESELRETVAGLFDTIIVMPIISVENTHVSTASNQGDGVAATMSESNVLINNTINVLSVDTLLESSPFFVVGGTGSTAVEAPTVGFPVWVPWSRELIPLLVD